MDQIVTTFHSVLESKTPFYKPVSYVLDRIGSDTNKVLIEKIRKQKDKDKRNELKKELPAVCFSGKFTKRADNAMEQHSGLICLDFDGFKDEKKMLKLKKGMTGDDYVFSVFVSPSGKGLKVLVKVTEEFDNHRGHFRALEGYYGCDEFDSSCINESRVCYESYDPDIYVNADSEVWTETEEEKEREVSESLNSL